MLTTANALADAQANAKIFGALAIAGAFFGAAFAPLALIMTIEDVAVRKVMTVPTLARLNIARVDVLAVSNRDRENRILIAQRMPDLLEKIDSAPAWIGAGAIGGAVGLPLIVAGGASIRKHKKNEKEKRGKTPERKPLW